MKRKSFKTMQCPIAQTLENVGEWWSMLILRDATFGRTRFDQFEESLGISPGILSRRLKTLVENGFMEKIIYSDSPVKTEYKLTSRGEAFVPVLMQLVEFGNEHFIKEGKTSIVVDTATGAPANLILVDQVSRKPSSWPEFAIVPGLLSRSRGRGGK